MSWRGFKKAVSRLPHQVLAKTGQVKETIDEEFNILEKRFKDLERTVDNFYLDAKKFRDSVITMVTHQKEFAEVLSDIFQPLPFSEEDSTPSPSQEAVTSFVENIFETEQVLRPELEQIEIQVLQPIHELSTILSSIRKTIVKRSHKKIDYDRFRDSLRKLEEKNGRSLDDEKRLVKVKSDYEAANHHYGHYNSALKTEIPYVLDMRPYFIEPILKKLYLCQRRIYQLLLEKLTHISQLRQLDTTHDVIEVYNSQMEALTEAVESLDLLGKKLQVTFAGTLPTSPVAPVASGSLQKASSESPPPYTPASGISPTEKPSSASRSLGNGAITARRAPLPPPPPPAPSSAAKIYVIALYDYEAQSNEDLSFKKDDRIEVIQKTEDVNDWWTGRLNGQTGLFPANYVTEI